MQELVVFIGVCSAVIFVVFIISRVVNYFTAKADRRCFLSGLEYRYAQARNERRSFERENNAKLVGPINRDYQLLVRVELGIIMEITSQFPGEEKKYDGKICRLVEKMNESIIL